MTVISSLRVLKKEITSDIAELPTLLEVVEDSIMSIGASFMGSTANAPTNNTKAPIEKAVRTLKEIPTKFTRMAVAVKDNKEKVS